MPVVNTAGVAVGFEALPEGDYQATFTSFKNDKSTVKDVGVVPSIRMQFTVDEPEEHAGKKLFMNQTLIATGEKANLHFLKKNLVDLGADPADLDAEIDTDDILNDLIGAKVTLKVTIRPYQGNNYNNVVIKSAGSSDGWSSE